ncbi:MAG: hypothetical protein PSV35_09770 [bacterium]|nr:hypothetical protein [bacterium]
MWITKIGRCIHTSPSGYKVYQNFFYRWLTLGNNALQTVINRKNPKQPVLHYISPLTLMVRNYPYDCCLLGLGGAGVIHLLKGNSFSPQIVAVDISGEVIDIAKHYFMLDCISNINIVEQNAADYVQALSNKFSHIIIDLYGADHFPVECTNSQFFFNCKIALKKDGFISFNLANLREQWPIFTQIKKHFKNTLVIPVKKSANIVIIASNHEHIDLFIEKIRSSGEIEQIHVVSLWGYVGQYL